ncbi:DsbA family protein [Pseudoclavibacter sp. AY1H1]|uniref:DsbA family protein n=1 Tax=Pseudoclavibacter sp. AY1H1 TaxID=2080584 RepID=UPI0015E3992C|nr:DsbA family protein [Pseudoclavibacter sp. AY1H1]
MMNSRHKLTIAATILSLTFLVSCSSSNSDAELTSTDGNERINEIALFGDSPATLSPSIDAPVTLVEFADYQCPPCEMVSEEMLEMAQTYPDDLSVVIRNFPLSEIHPNALSAAKAAEAARAQGEFRDMYKSLFEGQEVWSDLTADQAEEIFEGYALDLGLDVDRFRSDFASASTSALIESDMADGSELGVGGTPTLFLDGERVNLTSIDELAVIVDAAVQRSRNGTK